jgi:hypothetical protein
MGARAASRTLRHIFGLRTGFVTLDRLLQRLHANKAELLTVLDRPDIPLDTNGSENGLVVALVATLAATVAMPSSVWRRPVQS